MISDRVVGESRGRVAGEGGSALVLALLFLTVCGVTVGGLMSFATTSSDATIALRASRGSEYDTEAAMEAAIATVRMGNTCGTGASGFTPTWPLNSPGQPVRVDCFVLSSVSGQRNDEFSVCAATVSPPCPDSQARLRADVIFYDSPTLGYSVGIQAWSNE